MTSTPSRWNAMITSLPSSPDPRSITRVADGESGVPMGESMSSTSCRLRKTRIVPSRSSERAELPSLSGRICQLINRLLAQSKALCQVDWRRTAGATPTNSTQPDRHEDLLPATIDQECDRLWMRVHDASHLFHRTRRLTVDAEHNVSRLDTRTCRSTRNVFHHQAMVDFGRCLFFACERMQRKA